MSERREDRRAALVQELVAAIHQELCRPLTVMEVCGTHTMSIHRWGLPSLLPPELHLISGPGCPVCVTDSSLVSQALAIAAQPEVIFTSFGDMLRVPAGDNSLQRCRDLGGDVRVVLSPLDALTLAEQNPDRQVVFFAVGFETTAPLTAAVLCQAAAKQVKNFSILCAHKTMPQAIRCLLREEGRVDALLCPGHVAVIIGADGFNFVAEELHRPAAVAGFEPEDILSALLDLVRQDAKGKCRLSNCYSRAVTSQGNLAAQGFLERVFAPADVAWRGLGLLPGSGLTLRPEWAEFDAERRFGQALAALPPCDDPPGCCCGQVLRGQLSPEQCPLFGRACTPRQPVGACMVSSEGACAAAYRYRQV